MLNTFAAINVKVEQKILKNNTLLPIRIKKNERHAEKHDIAPQTEWVQPTEYPDLRSYDEIAIDLETRDPDLKSKGSGAVHW